MKKKKSNRGKSSILPGVLFVIFLVIGVVSAFKVYEILAEYKEGKDTYASLESFVQPAAPVEVQTQLEETVTEDESSLSTEPVQTWPAVDFEALKEMNDDCVGWILIEDTRVNYPIVQAADNDYYLYRMFDRTWNGAGCIFMDSRVPADFSGRNHPVYGHQMKNGTMFSAISGYKNQEYYDTHQTGYLMTPDGAYQIEFFAGFVSATSGNAWDLEFDSDEDFSAWLESLQRRSCFASEVQPGAEDTIITLSTCSYEFDDARFVLFGRLVRL